MKRSVCLMLIFSMLLTLLAGCVRPTEPEEPILPALDMVTAIAAAMEDALTHEPQRVDSRDPEQLATYAELAYGLSEGKYEDCAAVIAIGAQAYEIAVLRFADQEAAARGEESLKTYRKLREGAFSGYAPEQAAIVAKGIVCRKGTYVGLFICKAPEAAEAVFTEILTSGKVPEAPSEPEPTVPSESEPAAEFEPELAVDMRALMVALIDRCMDGITAAGEFRYIASFNAYGDEDEDARQAFLAEWDADLDSGAVEAGFRILAGEDGAFAVTVLCLADAEAAAGFSEALGQESDGRIVQKGRYLAQLKCPSPEAAEAGLEAALLAVQSAEPGDSTLLTEPPADLKGLSDWLVAETWEELSASGRVLRYRNGLVERPYGIDPNLVRRNVKLKSEQAEEYAYEMLLLCMVSEAAAVRGMDGLRLYLLNRQAELEAAGLPEQAAVAAKGCVVREGRYLALLISRDAAALKAGFAGALQAALQPVGPQEPTFLEANWFDPQGEPDPNYPDRIRFTSPGREDMSLYDLTAILAAWEARNPEGLSEYDSAIYTAAQGILEELLTEGMGDYEKEVAIYGWVVGNIDYDWTQLDVLTETPRTSFTPYGGIVDRRAVCLGAAMSFELLLRMAGIECITVVGAAEDSVEDHAWNVVRLGGQWYCADPTWDLGNGWAWYYFNVTSDYMAETDHQWDYLNTPEATATDHGVGR